MKVSAVIPIYNEEKYIAACVESLLEQTFPQSETELIFVDGMSTDRTLEILSTYVERYPELIRVLKNENRTVPYAMNIGILDSRGEYIIRLDAHAEYATDYFEKCIKHLELTGADNVGGVLETKGRGFIGKAVAAMVSSRFGVGGSKFRIGSEDGYVDTVPFGAFPRETFDTFGLYDVRLDRNQDNELNHRIRKGGGRIFLTNEVKLVYYARDSISGISKMALKNGEWNIITSYIASGSMGIRHFIPMIFVLSLVILSTASIFWAVPRYILAAELIAYAVLDIVYSFKAARTAGDIRLAAVLLVLFPIFHISYGIGSIVGLFKLLSGRFRSER